MMAQLFKTVGPQCWSLIQHVSKTLGVGRLLDTTFQKLVHNPRYENAVDKGTPLGLLFSPQQVKESPRRRIDSGGGKIRRRVVGSPSGHDQAVPASKLGMKTEKGE